MRYRTINFSRWWESLGKDDKTFFLLAGCWYLVDIIELVLLFIFSRLEVVKLLTKDLPTFQIDNFEVLMKWADVCDKIIKQTGCTIWIIFIVGVFLGIMAAYLVVRGLKIIATSQFRLEYFPLYSVVLLGIFIMTIILCMCIKILVIPLIASFLIVGVINFLNTSSS